MRKLMSLVAMKVATIALVFSTQVHAQDQFRVHETNHRLLIFIQQKTTFAFTSHFAIDERHVMPEVQFNGTLVSETDIYVRIRIADEERIPKRPFYGGGTPWLCSLYRN